MPQIIPSFALSGITDLFVSPHPNRKWLLADAIGYLSEELVDAQRADKALTLAFQSNYTKKDDGFDLLSDDGTKGEFRYSRADGTTIWTLTLRCNDHPASFRWTE